MAETLRFHYDVDGDNFTSAGAASVEVKRKLRQLVDPQRRHQLRRRAVEMLHPAGAIEQHRRVRHAGHHRAHHRQLHRIDAELLLACGNGFTQPPGHQRGGDDAQKAHYRASRRQAGKQPQRGEHERRGQQNDRGIAQPVGPLPRPGRVDRHGQ